MIEKCRCFVISTQLQKGFKKQLWCFVNGGWAKTQKHAQYLSRWNNIFHDKYVFYTTDLIKAICHSLCSLKRLWALEKRKGWKTATEGRPLPSLPPSSHSSPLNSRKCLYVTQIESRKRSTDFAGFFLQYSVV